jgi:hypothetical protein
MSFFEELQYEQDDPSMGRLHVATHAREPATLLRSPAVRVGTSLCQMEMNR